MTRLLILYGTTDGQTAKIADYMAGELRSKGAAVAVVRAGTADPDPCDYDGVLVAASIHAGGYQRAVVRWARRHAEALRVVPAAFVSVCLGVLQKDLAVQHELGAIINRFERRTGWKPLQIRMVAGALRYTRYNLLKRMLMRQIVRKAGGDTDTRRDYEYTDWAELGAFANAFHAMCRVMTNAVANPACAPAPKLAKAG